jgi:hypothetical protein
MEPLKPETKEQILRDRPQASPADLEEYERLLSERFTVDPDLPKSPAATRDATDRERRLEQLYQMLFGSLGEIDTKLSPGALSKIVRRAVQKSRRRKAPRKEELEPG